MTPVTIASGLMLLGALMYFFRNLLGFCSLEREQRGIYLTLSATIFMIGVGLFALMGFFGVLESTL